MGNPLPLIVVVAIEVGLMAAVENYRKTGSGPSGYSPGVGKYDSSIFDGLDDLYPGGRFAMVSILAFAIQSYVTGEGPYANWSKHVNDPFGYNLITILGSEDRTPVL